jgi:hypothetical protein
LASLQAEIERLKQVVPDQAHAMQDILQSIENGPLMQLEESIKV